MLHAVAEEMGEELLREALGFAVFQAILAVTEVKAWVGQAMVENHRQVLSYPVLSTGGCWLQISLPLPPKMPAYFQSPSVDVH